MLAGLLGTLCAASAVHAQVPEYPATTLRIIVPHAVGGAADALTRGIAERLSGALHRPVIVDNKPGASGIIGATACAKAPNDGSVVCMTNNDVISLNPFLFPKLPYDPDGDLVPVASVASLAAVLLVSSKVPANSLQALVALAKEKPETITFGSFGTGSIGHLYAEWLGKAAGAKFLHVPYRGAGPVLTAALAGEVDVILFQAGAVVPYIKDGKLKPLAVLGRTRSPMLPGVPTFAEQGFRFYVNPWVGLFAPARTPKAVVDRLHVEINTILSDPTVKRQVFDAQTAEPMPQSQAAFAAFLRADREDSRANIQITGIRLEDK
jgi:tripartite-type tricarboxylate transporter receptor subunit TctC